MPASAVAERLYSKCIGNPVAAAPAAPAAAPAAIPSYTAWAAAARSWHSVHWAVAPWAAAQASHSRMSMRQLVQRQPRL